LWGSKGNHGVGVLMRRNPDARLFAVWGMTASARNGKGKTEITFGPVTGLGRRLRKAPGARNSKVKQDNIFTYFEMGKREGRNIMKRGGGARRNDLCRCKVVQEAIIAVRSSEILFLKLEGGRRSRYKKKINAGTCHETPI